MSDVAQMLGIRPARASTSMPESGAMVIELLVLPVARIGRHLALS